MIWVCAIDAHLTLDDSRWLTRIQFDHNLFSYPLHVSFSSPLATEGPDIQKKGPHRRREGLQVVPTRDWGGPGKVESTHKNFCTFCKKSGQKWPKTASTGEGSSAGCCSLSALVSLWALNTVNPCTQSYGSLAGEFIPCQNFAQKWLHTACALSFLSLKLLTPRSVFTSMWIIQHLHIQFIIQDA